MKIPFTFRSISLFSTVVFLPFVSLEAQDEKTEPPPATAPAPAETAPSAPEPAAEPAPAPVPASSLETWLALPSTIPAPSREEIEQFLTGLQQRQQDLSKTIDFLVSRKRLRQESAAKANETIAIPEGLTLEHWDGIIRDQKEGKLNEKDFSEAVVAFAGKLRTINASQQAESLKLSRLMLQHSTDEDNAPVRHHPRTTSSPAATPVPVMRAILVHPASPGKNTSNPAASKPASGKPAAGAGNKAN